MIPGSNILKTALKIIGTTPFVYRQYDTRSTNDIGVDVVTYHPDVNLSGSVQAVPRNRYESLGLDMKKDYITIYTVQPIGGVERDKSGDMILFNNREYQVLSENDWQPIDGWNGILCVRVS